MNNAKRQRLFKRLATMQPPDIEVPARGNDVGNGDASNVSPIKNHNTVGELPSFQANPRGGATGGPSAQPHGFTINPNATTPNSVRREKPLLPTRYPISRYTRNKTQLYQNPYWISKRVLSSCTIAKLCRISVANPYIQKIYDQQSQDSRWMTQNHTWCLQESFTQTLFFTI